MHARGESAPVLRLCLRRAEKQYITNTNSRAADVVTVRAYICNIIKWVAASASFFHTGGGAPRIAA